MKGRVEIKYEHKEDRDAQVFVAQDDAWRFNLFAVGWVTPANGFFILGGYFYARTNCYHGCGEEEGDLPLGSEPAQASPPPAGPLWRPGRCLVSGPGRRHWQERTQGAAQRPAGRHHCDRPPKGPSLPGARPN